MPSWALAFFPFDIAFPAFVGQLFLLIAGLCTLIFPVLKGTGVLGRDVDVDPALYHRLDGLATSQCLTTRVFDCRDETEACGQWCEMPGHDCAELNLHRLTCKVTSSGPGDVLIMPRSRNASCTDTATPCMSNEDCCTAYCDEETKTCTHLYTHMFLPIPRNISLPLQNYTWTLPTKADSSPVHYDVAL